MYHIAVTGLYKTHTVHCWHYVGYQSVFPWTDCRGRAPEVYKSLPSQMRWRICVLPTFLSWDTTFNTHNLKEEKLVLAHGYSLWLVGSKAERSMAQGDRGRKAGHIMVARKQRTKACAREGGTPFQVTLIVLAFPTRPYLLKSKSVISAFIV